MLMSYIERRGGINPQIIMDSNINIYDVVRYFVEKSGMLFFYTPEDLKKAYDRINVILESKKKYNNIDITEEQKKLDVYYNFFIKNFKEYSEKNRALFVEIMKIDSNIMFCGSNIALERYMKEITKQLKEANSAQLFFKRRYAVREGKLGIKKIISKIEEYRFNYNLDIEYNKIDEILKFLKLSPLAKENEIIEAYNSLIYLEYTKIVDVQDIDAPVLEKTSKYFSYIRDIIAGVYDLDEELEKKSLYNMYYTPLNTENEYNDALQFFKLEPTCTKEKMITTVERVIDELTYANLMRSINPINNPMMKEDVGSRKIANDIVETAEHYKKVLYNFFQIEEKTVKSDEEKETTVSYEELFSGLEYVEARQLYFNLLNQLLNSSDEMDKSKITELTNYWESIQSEYIITETSRTRK